MRYFDNTRISTYRACPRKYYYRHVRHWVRDGEIPAALVFGLSWHDSMDVIWGLAREKISDVDLAKTAFIGFCKQWEENGLPNAQEFMDNPAAGEKYGMRNPMNAFEMILEYVKVRRSWIKEHGVIAIEQPFVTDLPDTTRVKYVGRLDKVIEALNKDIFIGEHKTTSAYAKIGNFRKEFIESFSPNSQVDGYSYTGRASWGARFRGVYIDAALVHKTVHNGFKLIPVDRQTGAIENFVVEVNSWINKILEDTVYPKNTDACWDYNSRCGYYDLCKFHNKTATIQDIPLGFKIDKWEPYERLELERIGLEPEDEI